MVNSFFNEFIFSVWLKRVHQMGPLKTLKEGLLKMVCNKALKQGVYGNNAVWSKGVMKHIIINAFDLSEYIIAKIKYITIKALYNVCNLYKILLLMSFISCIH